jgi:hypothetical protein
MGVADMAEKAAADAAYEQGGWTGWMQFKLASIYQKCDCCK